MPGENAVMLTGFIANISIEAATRVEVVTRIVAGGAISSLFSTTGPDLRHKE